MAQDAGLVCRDDGVWFFPCLTPGVGWKYLYAEIELTRGKGAVARLWPLLCGDLGSAAGNLIHWFRTECFQLEKPVIDLAGCDATGERGSDHSPSYADRAELRCVWCGRRPFWPLHECAPADQGQTTAEWDGGTCFQREEPFIWHSGCPAVGVGGLHSDGYSQDGVWLCQWCGARPSWPAHECASFAFREQARWHFPYLCTGWEVFATATYDGQATLGLCWVKP